MNFYTRSEIKRAVFIAQEAFPHCRPGQAYCNHFQIRDSELESRIYELKTFEAVVQAIYEYSFKE